VPRRSERFETPECGDVEKVERTRILEVLVSLKKPLRRKRAVSLLWWLDCVCCSRVLLGGGDGVHRPTAAPADTLAEEGSTTGALLEAFRQPERALSTAIIG